ncbi:MAG: hypothetical protein ABSH14_14465 [Verrucomicrobiia bacterium]|jgi:DNA-binding PadR family transcriptional regulator
MKDRKALAEFRIHLLAALYKCRPVALKPATLLQRIRSGMPEADKDQVQPELQYFVDKGYVVEVMEPLGATRYYRLHANGVDYMERSHWDWVKGT